MNPKSLMEQALAGSLDGELAAYRLEDLRLEASIGIYDFEIAHRQTVHVSVTVFARLDWDRTDRISQVLDYDYLRSGIQEMVAQRHFNLQETLCEACLDLALKPEKALAATVEVQKTDVYANAKSVGCTLFRRKDMPSPR
jgi:dihydroneopterin aldolase